jgi:hypothetical protein
MLLEKSRGQLEMSPDLALRLKIKLDPGDEETGVLSDLPWELLCDDETEEFFALSRQMSVIRYLDVPRPARSIPFTPPLRVLAVSASPRSLPPLDLEEEVRRLQSLNESSSGVAVEFLAHASASAVREALLKETYNVLHFMGHGTFNEASGEGMLAFEEKGDLDLVSGKAFANKLRDVRSLGVIVLNACETARARHQGGGKPFRGAASALVLGGIPAVVAMQRPISDVAAIGFSNAFYQHLARGASIDESLTEGRQAIYSAKSEEFEWATPVLFLRMPEGNVFVPNPEDQQEKKDPPMLAPPTPEAPLPKSVQASPMRGLVLKITTGALSVVLVIFVVIKAATPHSGSKPEAGETPVVMQTPSDLLKDVEPELKRRENVEPKPKRPAQTLIRQPSAVDEPTFSPTPAPAPAADLSGLSAQVLSLTRRDGGGLRLTVSFRNAADHPVSAVLDAESSTLSSSGRPYSILDSDLPAVDSNWRLVLTAGASSSHTFDFPEPKLGSTEFFLALRTEDGGRIKLSNASIKAEGSP